MNTSAPKKPCRAPGCHVLGVEAYCPEHAAKRKSKAKEKIKAYDKERGSAQDRGYDAKWNRFAAAYRKSNPLCVMCEKVGVYTLAQCVDHIIPHKGNMELFWDTDNVQGLCTKCHTTKTASEDGGWSNPIKR